MRGTAGASPTVTIPFTFAYQAGESPFTRVTSSAFRKGRLSRVATMASAFFFPTPGRRISSAAVALFRSTRSPGPSGFFWARAGVARRMARSPMSGRAPRPALTCAPPPPPRTRWAPLPAGVRASSGNFCSRICSRLVEDGKASSTTVRLPSRLVNAAPTFIQ